MRIGIDLHALHSLMQGSRTYISNLTSALLVADEANEYVLYLPRDIREDEIQAWRRGNVEVRYLKCQNRILRLCLEFPFRLRRDRIDVFHCQYVPPLLCPCPYVVTIHDILHEVYPEFYPGKLRRLMKLTYPIGARHAARVITGSDYSREQIHQLYRVPQDHIVVTPYAASHDFEQADIGADAARAANKYGVSGPYILFVGRIEPRKNIHGLIRAYQRARQKAGITHTLAIGGMKDPLFEEFFEDVLGEKQPEGVSFIGGVSQEDLPDLYAGADLFVYPSTAEGFGLPVLEAMACGTPVVCSNTTSLPEVIGEAGITVDPKDVVGLSEAISRVVSPGSLREDMIRQGQDRAKTFSWARAAKQTIAVYRAIVNGSN
ncbi:MAG: glycosyltransferase family 1 protein [Kiritimatiellia bacterium]|jgi:glycosyltransferase involved in cell wall biosynthesis|nr:glycosyltransferase family 1 protein [Kiritimatiellia bacterium]MDP6848217.1 glycosyltransferase family 1 protein [Kiritimatiellia bacterium]